MHQTNNALSYIWLIDSRVILRGAGGGGCGGADTSIFSHSVGTSATSFSNEEEATIFVFFFERYLVCSSFLLVCIYDTQFRWQIF